MKRIPKQACAGCGSDKYCQSMSDPCNVTAKTGTSDNSFPSPPASINKIFQFGFSVKRFAKTAPEI